MFRGDHSYHEPWGLYGQQKDSVADYKMKFRYPFKDPDNAQMHEKKIVDCASPPSTIKESSWWRTHGHGPGAAVMHNSINHMIMTPEDVPFTDSYSTWDCCKVGNVLMNLVYMNWYIVRIQAGSLNPLSPHTKWAHNVVMWTGVARVNLAWLVGCCGYFYGYEFMYTYVPFLRINDPTPEGWKLAHQEGQSTYGARALACLFPALGYCVWKGSFKKSAFWFSFAMWNALYYEVGRVNVFNGSIQFLGFLNTQQNDRINRIGNLVPDVDRRIDPDTGKPFHAASYQNLRLTHSPMWDLIHENKTHDNCPQAWVAADFPNPWFNFQKMAQTTHERPIRYKTEIWKMPNVTSAITMSGANDR